MNNRNNIYDYPYGNEDMDMINEMLLNNNINNNMMPFNSKNNNINLAGSYDAYIRGNLYNNLYDQYKNYKPAKLIPNNEQAELLLNVNQTTFAAHDIRLYLDNYPDDRKMIKLFNDYQMASANAIREYENKYGPLQMDTMSDVNMFSWESYNWPWEMEEM